MTLHFRRFIFIPAALLFRTTACGSLSSRRFKEDINSLTEASGLAEVLALRPVSFKYTPAFLGSDINNPNWNGDFTGFIAEEVQQIDPRLIEIDTGGLPDSVRYDKITAVLVKAAQEMNGALNISGALTGTSTLLSSYQGSAVPAITVDASGNVGIGINAPSNALDVNGVVSANGFVVSAGSLVSTPTAQIPSAVFTSDGKGIDLYKLATYNLATIQAVASSVDALTLRITSLDQRVTNLENASTTIATTTMATSTPDVILSSFAAASTALSSALSDALSLITNSAQSGVNELGIAVHAGLGIFDKIFAREVHTDQLCVGSVCVTQDQFLKMVQSSSAAAATSVTPVDTSGTSATSTTPDTTATTTADTSTSTPTTLPVDTTVLASTTPTDTSGTSAASTTSDTTTTSTADTSTSTPTTPPADTTSADQTQPIDTTASTTQ